MLSFRYHIVSIVAVFLALAVGIVMGTTVVSSGTLSVVESNLENVRQTNDRLRTDNRELADRLSERASYDRDLIDEAAPWAGRDQLAERSVLVIRAQGVDDDDLEGLNRALAGAGATDLGTLSPTDDLDLDAADERSRLAERLDADRDAEVDELRSLLAERLSAALTAAPAPAPVDPNASTTTTSTAPPDPTEPLLQGLIADGFLRFQAAAGSESVYPEVVDSTRLLFVWGPDATGRPTDLMLPVLAALAEGDDPVRAAAVEVRPDDDRSGLTAAVRRSTDLATRVPTVDDVDDLSGMMATVLVLAAMPDGPVGHYGRGDGATALLPGPPASRAG